MRGNALQQDFERCNRRDMPAEMGRHHRQSMTADKPCQHAQIEIEARLSGVAQAHAQAGPMRRHRHFRRRKGRQDHLAPQRAFFEIFKGNHQSGKARIDHHHLIGADQPRQMTGELACGLCFGGLAGLALSGFQPLPEIVCQHARTGQHGTRRSDRLVGIIEQVPPSRSQPRCRRQFTLHASTCNLEKTTRTV